LRGKERGRKTTPSYLIVPHLSQIGKYTTNKRTLMLSRLTASRIGTKLPLHHRYHHTARRHVQSNSLYPHYKEYLIGTPNVDAIPQRLIDDQFLIHPFVCVKTIARLPPLARHNDVDIPNAHPAFLPHRALLLCHALHHCRRQHHHHHPPLHPRPNPRQPGPRSAPLRDGRHPACARRPARPRLAPRGAAHPSPRPPPQRARGARLPPRLFAQPG
jgi:hypothetical protein